MPHSFAICIHVNFCRVSVDCEVRTGIEPSQNLLKTLLIEAGDGSSTYTDMPCTRPAVPDHCTIVVNDHTLRPLDYVPKPPSSALQITHAWVFENVL